jgi:hypothetical protein
MKQIFLSDIFLKNSFVKSKISLIVLSTILIFAFFACLKESEKSYFPPVQAKLTLERAKSIIEQTGVDILGIHDREGEEGADIGVQLRLGWNNGSEYYHQGLGLEVVEIPILESNLSKTHHVGDSINQIEYVD